MEVLMGKRETAYKKSGVDYGAMDPFKIMCQKAGLPTASTLLRNHGFREVRWSRGESCYLIEQPDRYLGFNIEGLGTKNLAANAQDAIYDRWSHRVIAYDNVAMTVNDFAPLGVQPLVYGFFLAAGSGTFFKNKKAARGVVDGVRAASEISSMTWACGETQTVVGNVTPEGLVLAGSSVGQIYPKNRLMSPFFIEEGDAIVLLASNEIHANGLTLARKIATTHPEGFKALMRNGQRYIDALLQPTQLYNHIVQQCLNNRIPLHYGVHVTGHGWAKLMRSPQPFRYVVDTVPPVPELFQFIQRNSKERISGKEMYHTFNMGVGFVLYVPVRHMMRVLAVARRNNVKASVGGFVERSRSGKRTVVLPKKNIRFTEDDLKVR